MKLVEIMQFDRGTTLILKGVDDVNAIIDEQTVATQAMLGSSNCRNQVKKDT